RAAAADGCTPTTPGAGSGGRGEKVPAGGSMLIVNGPDPRIWPRAALNRRAERPKIRPYFLASGWNPAI
ncbi:hypothetical protein, partial [Bradyrhizobium lablabi]|uniref:hypothetical protein n=1 Tax=Bradyrhizobium lablabi TaxID=722472 RepID=UPI000A514FC9